MAFRKKGLASYGEVSVQAGTAYADSVQLIQMLFDGLIDSLSAAGQIERNEIEAKGESLNRATRILLGLQGSLDSEKGWSRSAPQTWLTFMTIARAACYMPT